MNQNKRLPQAGETWWLCDGVRRFKLIDGPDESFPLQSSDLHLSWTKQGLYWKGGHKCSGDLALIYSDAKGKVINPTFNGGVPVVPDFTPTKAKPTKPNPIEESITAAQERVEGLKDLQQASQELANRRGDVKLLAAREKELRIKWMPVGPITKKLSPSDQKTIAEIIARTVGTL